jgi:excinuclease ABC subunit B
VDGLVIFYADTITESMQKAMDETARRREKQISYNIEHKITPTTIRKSVEQIMGQTSVLDIKGTTASPYAADDLITIAAEEQGEYLVTKKTIPQMEKLISNMKRSMEKAARDLDFMEAAKLRDEMFRLQKELEGMKQ